MVEEHVQHRSRASGKLTCSNLHASPCLQRCSDPQNLHGPGKAPEDVDDNAFAPPADCVALTEGIDPCVFLESLHLGHQHLKVGFSVGRTVPHDPVEYGFRL